MPKRQMAFFIVVARLLQIDVIAIKKAYSLIFYILIIYGGSIFKPTRHGRGLTHPWRDDIDLIKGCTYLHT